MEKRFDVIILGAGPAGYVAAIRLAQLGKKVAVVEEARVGGVCLNSGCIPTKALLEVTSIKDRLNKFSGKGIEIKGISFDLERLLSWKNGVVNKLVKGIEFLLRKNGVELYQGRGVIEESGVVRVGSDMFYSENIVIATGSKPRELP
ncbi:MAG: dihydrolipoyl dehydrogenase, partial [Chloroflexi bacterium]